MLPKFERRRFLTSLGAATTMLAGTGAAGRRALAQAQAVEPSARALVEGMAQALSSARTMRFSVTTLMDGDASTPLPDIYKLVSSAKVLFARPNRLRVQYGAPVNAELLGDGEKTTVFVPARAMKAQLAVGQPNQAPEATVAYDAVMLPFIDLVLEKAARRFTDDLRVSQVLVRDIAIDGVPSDVVFLSTPSFHGEIWIGKADRLPRHIVGTWTRGIAGKPTAAATLYSGWSLDQPVSDADFLPAGLADAKTVPFAELFRK